MVLVEEEDVDDDEGGSDGDGGVSDVEGGPVIAAEPDLEEVGDGAVDDAIGNVAGGAAEEQRQAGGGQRAAAVTGDEEPGQRGDDGRGADDQQDAHRGGGRIGEDAEGDAWIAAVHQVDEVGDQLAMPAFNGLRFKPGFAGAIDEDHGQGEPEPAETRGDHDGLDVRSPRRVLATDLGIGRESGGPSKLRVNKTAALQNGGLRGCMGGCAFDFG